MLVLSLETTLRFIAYKTHVLLQTGMGLWPKTNIEFRGAAFPSGGDATIDGLVTIPSKYFYNLMM